MKRCDVGSDGKTSTHRLHGQHADSGILGEDLYMSTSKSDKAGPTNLSWSIRSSSEALVVTEQGSAIKKRAANVPRIRESERWDADRILGMRAVA